MHKLQYLIPVISTLIFASNSICGQETISLNGNWQFKLARSEKEALILENFQNTDFKAKGFSEIPVPSNWAILGYEEPVYRGFHDGKASEGFYRLHFPTPEGFVGKRVFLKFGGVWSEADVWLNGEKLGTHSSGYTSFSYVISDKLRKDSTDNLLAVRVKQVSREYKFDTFDDWTLGGIYRDVTLEAMPSDMWIDYVTASTTFDANYADADLHVKTMVTDIRKCTLPGNYPSPGNPYRMIYTLTAPKGNIVEKREVEVPAHISTGREHHEVFHILKPIKWTAETPDLYTLTVELKDNGSVTQVWSDRIGIREVKTDGGVLRVNGQAVKLRGVNRHDEWPDVGRATRREHWLKDITMMKEANINYIRCSHYTPAEGFVRLCDSLGMYLSNEVALGGASSLIYDPSFNDAVLVRADETVKRDINRPSVIIWSIGNEDPLSTLHLSAVKYVKALDPTRPTLIPWRHEDWLPEDIDILSIHYWKPEEYDAKAGTACRPIVSTEYTHAYGNEGMGGLHERWNALTSHPSGAGAAIWMWADQGICTPTVRPSTYSKTFSTDEHLRIDGQGWDGIVDSYRNPTPDYWEAKAVYAPVFPVEQSAAYTPGDAGVLLHIRNSYDFTDLSSGNLRWQIFEDGEVLASGEDTISGVPHSDALFRLPVACLKDASDSRTHYAHISYIDKAGNETGKFAVELIPKAAPANSYVKAGAETVMEDSLVMVKADNGIYTFNPGEGKLKSIAIGGRTLAECLTPIIWRPLDACEQTSFIKNDRRYPYKFEDAVPEVISWSSDGNRISSEVRYGIAENEYYTVKYVYTTPDDSALTVRYELTPHISMTQLPIVGMRFRVVGATSLYWLGLGDGDSYPYKQRAQILGYWGGDFNATTGNKAVRRVDIGYGEQVLSISTEGYMWHPKGDEISILSQVYARPEKGRRAGDNMPQLRTDTGEPFIGEFTISIK